MSAPRGNSVNTPSAAYRVTTPQAATHRQSDGSASAVARERPVSRSLSLLQPSRLRPPEDAEEERHATWFELFFDLVFVVAVAQLAHEVEADPTGGGFLRLAQLFVPVWWAWVVYTFYADRFDTDDLAYRLMMMIGMLAVVVMAVNLPDAVGEGDGRFVVAYLVVRVVPLLLYLRVGRYVPIGRSIARRYGAGTAIAAALWLASLALPSPARYVFWVVAIAVELGIPLVNWRTVRAAPLHPSHIPERFGLFIIIVLGESVLAVATGLAGTDWQPVSILAAAGFFLACGLWWTYFDFFDETIVDWSFLARQDYVYGHLPAVAGLTAVGAGILLAVEHASDAALDAGARSALCGGVAAFLAALGAITHPPRVGSDAGPGGSGRTRRLSVSSSPWRRSVGRLPRRCSSPPCWSRSLP